ncbi:MAG: thioredoxin family protein [Candidatus Bathyarchaeia archaeon]|nr:thioredoxin family protein [Candidatus Nezhaarchaeota archaeon]
MREVKVEIIGPEPPCVRCQTVKKLVETVAVKLKPLGIDVKVEKLNITSGKVARKYGVLSSPALVINDAVKIQGRVPSEEEVESLIKEAAK